MMIYARKTAKKRRIKMFVGTKSESAFKTRETQGEKNKKLEQFESIMFIDITFN